MLWEFHPRGLPSAWRTPRVAMKLPEFLFLILGSVLFIPVSCTVGTVAGTKIVAWFDGRDVQKGDALHPGFSVVAFLPGSNDPSDFIVLPLARLKQARESGEALSFAMPSPSASKVIDRYRYTYRVLEDRGGEQKIEVVQVVNDGDHTIWSQYRATEQEVFPLSSRMFYFGYMFQAFPWALVCALGLYVVGRVFKRRYLKELKA